MADFLNHIMWSISSLGQGGSLTSLQVGLIPLPIGFGVGFEVPFRFTEVPSAKTFAAPGACTFPCFHPGALSEKWVLKRVGRVT